MTDGCVHDVSTTLCNSKITCVSEHVVSFDLSMGMPTSVMIYIYMFALNVFTGFWLVCLQSNPQNDKEIHSSEQPQTSHFRGKSVTRYFVTMTFDCPYRFIYIYIVLP